ncbi:Amino-acid acetyltransferase, mitochondrial [Lecanora helva]
MKLAALNFRKKNFQTALTVPRLTHQPISNLLWRPLTSRSGPLQVSLELGTAHSKHTVGLKEEASKRKQEDETSQDLFLDVLESTATKREAKAYLLKFGSQTNGGHGLKSAGINSKNVGVNLGSLYLPLRAVEESPIFSTSPKQSHASQNVTQSLHVAVVKIRAPQFIDESTLQGIGHTLSQLNQLGLSCVVVLDPWEDGDEKHHTFRAESLIAQVGRVVNVIASYGGKGARLVEGAIDIFSVNEEAPSSVKTQSEVQVTESDFILAPLRRGIIPILGPVGFNVTTQRLAPVIADEIILALVRDFAGLHANARTKENVADALQDVATPKNPIFLDRIIVLDALGGIPSTDKARGSHVFINLEQEFHSIRNELLNARADTMSLNLLPDNNSCSSLVKDSSPKVATHEAATAKSKVLQKHDKIKGDLRLSSMDIHLKNLELVNNALALLPPSSSALLTTPDAVADSESRPPLASQGPRVRTRRQRNPLIHNLLTDKPVSSSSLPSNRLRASAANSSIPTMTPAPATFVKRGMPLSIIPDPNAQTWAAPSDSKPSIEMSDPRIDLPRLVHLIDDSFNRKLDILHYLNRIQGRIAGVIIAGEYEGGAVLTWETPPGSSGRDPARMVPYLDKFAVLKRSQGAGGVADIVFTAMVRTCFPNGVCWRSRKNNPVNKWYFERAKGSWKIPGTNWTMFWTTEGVEVGDQVFSDYEAVCRTVEPSWADKLNVID